MDSPWDEDPDNTTFQDVEWARISEDFTNVGYREGITAGKEAASQEGFDVGFETIGVPIGRDIGLLRGVSSVVLSILKAGANGDANTEMLAEAQDVSSQLSRIRFSDVMPPDLEAEEHAREHLQSEGAKLDENEDIATRRDLEGIEDMLANLGSTNGRAPTENRPTLDDVRALKSRLGGLCNQLNLNIEWKG